MNGTSSLRVAVLEVGPLPENTYVVGHPESGGAVVIDPGGDGDGILRLLEEQRLVLEKILLTHGHFDHVGGVRLLKERTGADVCIHPADAGRMRDAPRQGAIFGIDVPEPPPPDLLLGDGDVIRLSDREFRVLHTPGHTPGHVIFLVEVLAFVGDLVFAGSVGRTDLPGGSPAALFRSVREKILTLPPETVLLPGHGPSTTVEREKRSNPFLSAEGMRS